MKTLTPFWTRNFVSDLFDEMDYFLSDVKGSTPARIYNDQTFGPACEISETEDHFHMSVDLPGMRQDEIKIEVINNQLVISGERKRETGADKSQKVQRFEKSYGAFKRSFTLPVTVNNEKIDAHYENGVLELFLPKAEVAKPRQIEIKAGKTDADNKISAAEQKSELKDSKL